MNQELQASFPALSTNSSHRIAKKAGHGIHVDEPGLVVEAILDVIEKAKSAPKKR